jgi:hypothetical protein
LVRTFVANQIQGGRDARLPRLAGREHPKRRVDGQPLRVVGVLVNRQAAVDKLAEEIHPPELATASATTFGEVARDERTQTEVLVTVAPQNSTRSWGWNEK